MRMAVWNELPDDTAAPASGAPGVAISVPATGFLGTLVGSAGPVRRRPVDCHGNCGMALCGRSRGRGADSEFFEVGRL